MTTERQRAEQERSRVDRMQVELDRFREEGDALWRDLKASISEQDNFKTKVERTSELLEAFKSGRIVGQMGEEMWRMDEELETL